MSNWGFLIAVASASLTIPTIILVPKIVLAPVFLARKPQRGPDGRRLRRPFQFRVAELGVLFVYIGIAAAVMHGLAQFHSGNSLPTLPEILTAVFLSVFAAQVWCFHVRMLDDARVLDGPKRCAFLVAVPCAYLGGLAGAAIVFAIPFSAVTNPEYLQWLVPVGAVLIVILACLRRTVVWVARPTLPSKGAPDEHLAS